MIITNQMQKSMDPNFIKFQNKIIFFRSVINYFITNKRNKINMRLIRRASQADVLLFVLIYTTTTLDGTKNSNKVKIIEGGVSEYLENNIFRLALN